MRVLCALLLVASVRPAAAQSPDAAPPGSGPSRLTVGGEATATYGSEDPGFFNYATYAYEPMRNVRVVIDGAVRASRRVEVLAQVRTDGTTQARVTAFYVRVRPWAARAFDLQAGRVPTAFGLFGRSGYGGDNPLIGRPLAYGYLTSLRRDALPAVPADLLRMRGRGWLSNFPVGNLAAERGLPIVDGDSWDTGVQARVVRGAVEWVGAVTQGSLGSPRLHDDNGGVGLSTRLVVRPTAALTFGASGARGAYLSRTLADDHGLTIDANGYRQNAVGLDAHVAAGRWQVRAEAIGSTWALPLGAGAAPSLTVRALTGWVESRVRVLPGLDVAARAEHLTFSELGTTTGMQPWEAPVSRMEAGVVLAPIRHVRIKMAVQRNLRPAGGRVRHDTLVAAQLGVWF